MRAMTMRTDEDEPETGGDHTSHPEFYEYYARESNSEATMRRGQVMQTTVLRNAAKTEMEATLETIVRTGLIRRRARVSEGLWFSEIAAIAPVNAVVDRGAE